MPGISLSSLFVAVWGPLAGANVLGALPSLPLSPVKLAILLVWFNLSLFLARLLEQFSWVPARFRALSQVVTLLGGPLAVAGLLFIDAGDPDEPTDRWQRAKLRLVDAWARLLHRSKKDDPLQLFDSKGTALTEIYGHSDSAIGDRHVLALTVQIIEDALAQRASDILIDPKDQSWYEVRLRIDGALRTVRTLPVATSRAVVNSVKAVASMDLAERRRPQDGAFSAKKANVTSAFRVASTGVLNGEKLAIRVLNQNASKYTLADLGVPERQRTMIQAAIHKPSGMVLICGPTGSGKTTSLYAMLNQIDRQTRNVISVEDPIEAHLANVSQIEINTKAGVTFAAALRSILRQDPDVICVGEIRDEETGEIAVRAAQTGHLVLATIHCDSNATALIRLLDLGVSPMMLSAGLSLVMSQRLIRKLCTQCRQPAQLKPEMVQALKQRGIDSRRIFQPGGCKVCGGTGFYGRMAVCDILSVTEELRMEIAHDPAIAAKLRNEHEKKSKATMKNETFRVVVSGLTSFDELNRVVG
jgi:type II secretory ATPase GspE/PulE/Tfp pilus assembly ATPase PilB-like protein